MFNFSFFFSVEYFFYFHCCTKRQPNAGVCGKYTGSSGNSSQRGEIICIESKRSFSSAFVLCTATKIVSNLNVRQTNTKRSEKICERELNSYSTEYYALGVHKSLYRRGNIQFEYFNNLFRIFARLIERH